MAVEAVLVKTLPLFVAAWLGWMVFITTSVEYITRSTSCREYLIVTSGMLDICVTTMAVDAVLVKVLPFMVATCLGWTVLL